MPWSKTSSQRQRNSGKLFAGSGGEIRTRSTWASSIEYILQWRKEHFEDPINPTNTHSIEEAEPEDFGLSSLITGVEVTRAVKQLHSRSTLGLEEIRPEVLKALDVVGLSWLTSLCNIARTLGTMPLE